MKIFTRLRQPTQPSIVERREAQIPITFRALKDISGCVSTPSEIGIDRIYLYGEIA